MRFGILPSIRVVFVLTAVLGVTVHSFQNVLSLKFFHLQTLRQQKISFSQLYVQIENADSYESSILPPKYDEVATTELSAPIGGSVNDRLLAELQQAAALEKSGIRNPSLRQNPLMKAASFFKSSKTDEERKAAIAEAQNLNGINPVTTFFGSMFALLCAAALWYGTQSLATYFALHPSDPNDAYFVARVTAVSRNVVMGLSALASGFFGVTGFGILLLSIRVGWGVITGELDPMPPAPRTATNPSRTADQFEMDNVWDLMLNKKPKRGKR